MPKAVLKFLLGRTFVDIPWATDEIFAAYASSGSATKEGVPCLKPRLPLSRSSCFSGQVFDMHPMEPRGKEHRVGGRPAPNRRAIY